MIFNLTTEPWIPVTDLDGNAREVGLAEIFIASRPLDEESEDDLQECCVRLEHIIGPIPLNRHGSLEALIVNEWGANDELVAMALLALGGSNVDSDYTEVTKVLL